jgi:hypothetical protein
MLQSSSISYCTYAYSGQEFHYQGSGRKFILFIIIDDIYAPNIPITAPATNVKTSTADIVLR